MYVSVITPLMTTEDGRQFGKDGRLLEGIDGRETQDLTSTERMVAVMSNSIAKPAATKPAATKTDSNKDKEP